MQDPGRLIDTFDREEYWWCKTLPCPFWGGEAVMVYIDVEDWEPGPTAAQLHILNWLLTGADDFRPEFESKLFDHYKTEIYGYAAYYSDDGVEFGRDEITPPIERAAEIWSLLKGPSIWIRYVSDKEWDGVPRVVLTFECHWDEEHGLSVEVTNGNITSFDAD